MPYDILSGMLLTIMVTNREMFAKVTSDKHPVMSKITRTVKIEPNTYIAIP